MRGTQKLANEMKIKAAPSVLFIDPDGEELHRAPFSDEASLKTAMAEALKKYAPKEISWSDRPTGSKPVVLVFADDKKESEDQLKNLTDRSLVKLQDKFEWMKVAYVKGDDEAKKWNLMMAPTVLIYDGSKENPEKNVLERWSGKKSPREIKGSLQKVLKKLEKK